MATFTTEEIDLLKSKGNEYCRKVWLGLYDGDQLFKDEQQIKEFMTAKYEKKRYYIKPSETDKISNGSISTPSSTSSTNSQSIPKLPTSSSFSFPTQNSNNNLSRNHNNNLFASQTFSTKPKEVMKTPVQDPFSIITSSTSNSVEPIDNFANFDNNPIFNSPQFINGTVPSVPVDNKAQGPPPPSEDRYAALKDLDCLMKSQQSNLQTENTVVSNSEWDPGNVWSTSANNQPNQFNTTSTNLFDSNPPSVTPSNFKELNPFTTNNTDTTWGNAFSANPFNADFGWGSTNGPSNGLPGSQSLNFNSAKPLWNNFGTTPNPFTVSSNGQSVSHHSSNPFL